MAARIHVSDTTAITNLAAIGRLDLMHSLLGQVFIPHEVYLELTRHGDRIPGAREVKTCEWILTRDVTRRGEYANTGYPSPSAARQTASARAQTHQLSVSALGSGKTQESARQRRHLAVDEWVQSWTSNFLDDVASGFYRSNSGLSSR